MKVIVLSKNVYSFANQDTGELVEGGKIHYIFDNGVEPAVLSVNANNKNMNILEEVSKVPGVYEFSLKTDVKKGQIVQTVHSAKFIKEVDLISLI